MPSPTPETASAPAPSSAAQLPGARVWISHWGVISVALVLSQACVRLGGLAWEAINMTLGPVEIAFAIFWVIFNGYGEGYRAFQLRFSPRVVLRAHELAHSGTPLTVLLAPLYCMNLIYAPKARMIVSWVAVVLITAVVAVVRRIDQPWRGLIDLGVVIALAWGVLAMLYFHVRALTSGQMPVVAERKRRKKSQPVAGAATSSEA